MNIMRAFLKGLGQQDVEIELDVQETTVLERISALCDEVDLAVVDGDNAKTRETLKQIQSLLKALLDTDLSLEEIANTLNLLAQHKLINFGIGRVFALSVQDLLIRYVDNISPGKNLWIILEGGENITLILANTEGTRLLVPAASVSPSSTLIGNISTVPVIYQRTPALMNLKITGFYIKDSEVVEEREP
ncbi:hypothetical protein KC640_02180 [Candidatus Dojkabacteria bacterium]|uniref:Uncharacterized protein n=1 Tax=Candidatus Dojkabacteria bacterium TaxID=2099670 RepID=A0A955I7B4_9BACT|nr:hypothetical protein [Candidatus Dojkabacteria bacterium]